MALQDSLGANPLCVYDNHMSGCIADLLPPCVLQKPAGEPLVLCVT